MRVAVSEFHQPAARKATDVRLATGTTGSVDAKKKEVV